MKPKNDPQPIRRTKRFRIEKLEERIAPAKGGKGTRNCGGGGSGPGETIGCTGGGPY